MVSPALCLWESGGRTGHYRSSSTKTLEQGLVNFHVGDTSICLEGDPAHVQEEKNFCARKKIAKEGRH